MEFVDGKVRHKKGNPKLFQFDIGPVRGMEQHRLSNGEIALWWMQNNNLHRWDPFAYSLMEGFAASPLEWPYADFTSYGDWLFINRAIGSIQLWNGADFVVLPEMPTNVRQLRKHLSFLLAIGTGSKKTGVSWSDANDISQWVPTRENTAGSVYIDEFEGGIVTAEQLGPVVAVYSENQMALISFIGAPFYFGQKVMLSGIGAVGQEAVTAAGGLNYGVSRQGIWQTNGESFQYIDSGSLHSYLQDNVNWAMSQLIMAVRNDVLRTLEFHFPMGSAESLTEGWSYDPATQGWSKVPPISFFSENLAFGLPLQADPLGEIQRVGGQNFSAEDLLLQTKPMLMHLQSSNGLTDVHFSVKVDEVELLLHEVRNVKLRVGSSLEHNSTITWSSEIILEATRSTYKVPAGVPDAPYWHLEFTNIPVTDDVEEEEVPVEEDGEQVISVTEATSWKLSLQGFMLFGIVDGAKDA